MARANSSQSARRSADFYAFPLATWLYASLLADDACTKVSDLDRHTLEPVYVLADPYLGKYGRCPRII